MLKRLVFALLLLLTAHPVFAQSGDEKRSFAGYFISADENRVLQVWRLADDATTATPLTNVTESVVDYAISPDESQLAYTSDQKLWLQTPDETLEIAALSREGRPGRPVFSEDGTQLAYANGGLWLYDIASGESRLLYEDNPYTRGMTDVDPVRYYTPLQFVDDSLIVRISLWEGFGPGVYDFERGAVEEPDRFRPSDLLMLSDRRVLVYGNNEVWGDQNLAIADSLDDINRSEVLVDLVALSPDAPLFVEEAIEIAPGMVRVMGSTYNLEGSTELPLFYFDLDTETGELSADGIVGYRYATSEENMLVWQGPPSPDAQFIVQYLNIQVATDLNPNGIIFGQLIFYNLLTGETLTPDLPNSVALFRWAE
ncbi:MAG: WD40 repeat domain-containing protein [bacterium]|nr:WD40 repeat domain-containing protein [bacterium]